MMQAARKPKPYELPAHLKCDAILNAIAFDCKPKVIPMTPLGGNSNGA
jgi:hypothetical protein